MEASPESKNVTKGSNLHVATINFHFIWRRIETVQMNKKTIFFFSFSKHTYAIMPSFDKGIYFDKCHFNSCKHLFCLGQIKKRKNLSKKIITYWNIILPQEPRWTPKKNKLSLTDLIFSYSSQKVGTCLKIT